MRINATSVAVPKTPADLNDFASGMEYQVGFPWKRGYVKSVPIAQSIDDLAELKFRSSVFALNPPHVLAAALSRNRVDQALTCRDKVFSRRQ
jgi:hypothetical protein